MEAFQYPTRLGRCLFRQRLLFIRIQNLYSQAYKRRPFSVWIAQRASRKIMKETNSRVRRPRPGRGDGRGATLCSHLTRVPWTRFPIRLRLGAVSFLYPGGCSRER